jgi:hypothetical protein
MSGMCYYNLVKYNAAGYDGIIPVLPGERSLAALIGVVAPVVENSTTRQRIISPRKIIELI